MHLQKARQKLTNFDIEIRRSHRDKLIRQLRYELTMSQTQYVNKQFKQFVDNKQSQIPQICLKHYKSIDLSLLSQLTTAIQQNQVSYRSKKQQKWFIDCTSINNLKFMSLQQIIACPLLLSDFFKETVTANYQKVSTYKQVFQTKGQKCMFSLVQNQTSGKLQIFKVYQKQEENEQNLQYEVNLLNFWSNYISQTEDEIHKEHFIQIMNIFKLFAQFKDILLKRQASAFIKSIFQQIKRSEIFIFCNKPNSSHFYDQLIRQCQQFICFIRMKMPYLIKKAVDYRLIYYEIAQILYRMNQLSKYIPNLFQQCVSQCQFLNNFIILLLRDEFTPQQTLINNKTALLVINCVAEHGIFNLLYLNQAINIISQLVNVNLFARTTQHLCSLVLYNIIDSDKQKYLCRIFELIDYKSLLDNLQQGSQNEVYQMLILILLTYNKSEIICTKILISNEFVNLLKKQAENRNIDKLVHQLAKVFRTHLQQFLQKYPKAVVSLYQLIKQHEFKQRDDFLKQLQSHFDLACKEAEL